MSDKHPLIVFSGGLDSTFMLWQALKEGDVHTCYIKGRQYGHKIPLELAAREKIIAFFQEKTGNKVLTDTIVDIGHRVEISQKLHEDETRFRSWNNDVPDVAWGQAYMWLFGIIHVSDGRQHTKVCFGNVMGDQISMHLHDMKAAWNHIQEFTKKNSIPLEFPLAYIPKDNILLDLPTEILPHLWVCELPYLSSALGVWHPCGSCAACNTMRKTIMHWEHVHEKDFRQHVEKYCLNLEEQKRLLKEAEERTRNAEKLHDDNCTCIATAGAPVPIGYIAV